MKLLRKKWIEIRRMLIYNNLVMKKLWCVLALVTLLATGCSFGTRDDGGNNLTVNKDGSIIQRIRESFDLDYYSADELKNMIIEEAASYNSKHTSGAVLANKIETAEGKADIELKYATVKDYSLFDEMLMYAGTIGAAETEGFSLGVILSDVNAPASTIAESDIKALSGNNILITNYSEIIYLPSKAMYISDNAIVSDDLKTVHLDPAMGGTMYVIYK